MYCTCFLLVELVFCVPIVVGILQAEERFSLIPNSTGKNQEDRNSDSFTWGRYILQQQHLRETSLRDIINTSVLDKDEP